MKASEIRSMTSEEIKRELEEAQRALFNLRFQRTVGRVENTARFRELRKDIARMKTILHERELMRIAEDA